MLNAFLASTLIIILTPAPLAHFLLHLFLPFWRQRPGRFYFTACLVWFLTAAFIWSRWPTPIEFLFQPTAAMRFSGGILMMASVILIIWAIITLHPKRFFLWAALRPESVVQTRITRGPYRFLSHPAYAGYELLSFGLLLSTGTIGALLLTGWLLVTMPILIRLEELELEKRIK